MSTAKLTRKPRECSYVMQSSMSILKGLIPVGSGRSCIRWSVIAQDGEPLMMQVIKGDESFSQTVLGNTWKNERLMTNVLRGITMKEVP